MSSYFRLSHKYPLTSKGSNNTRELDQFGIEHRFSLTQKEERFFALCPALRLCIPTTRCRCSHCSFVSSTGFSSEIGTKLRDWAVGQAEGSCCFQAALSSNDSKTLYSLGHGSTPFFPYVVLFISICYVAKLTSSPTTCNQHRLCKDWVKVVSNYLEYLQRKIEVCYYSSHLYNNQYSYQT